MKAEERTDGGSRYPKEVVDADDIALIVAPRTGIPVRPLRCFRR
jgi:hypothetical protein